MTFVTHKTSCTQYYAGKPCLLRVASIKAKYCDALAGAVVLQQRSARRLQPNQSSSAPLSIPRLHSLTSHLTSRCKQDASTRRFE